MVGGVRAGSESVLPSVSCIHHTAVHLCTSLPSRVNNCVGYYNYKFFLLFLFYTVLLCVYVNLSTVYDFYHIWVRCR